MLTALVEICLALLCSLAVLSSADSMLGPGWWRVLGVEECGGEYPVTVDIARHKVNRSHDGFDVKLYSEKEIGDLDAIRLDVCKRVDGGCKPYHTLADRSLPHFVRAYAADNARAFLARAGLSPPDFPIPAGSHEVQSFVFNYEELPVDGIYGTFGVNAYLLRAGREASCVRLDVEFVAREAE